MFFSLMDGNLRSHIKGIAVIPCAHNGETVADLRTLFKEKPAKIIN
jgi:hypothetical protein